MSDRLGTALEELASNSSRRGFLARLGGALVGGTAAGMVSKAVKPGDADAFHFCGHIFTTGSCLHPTPKLPRIDGSGYPLRADGRPIDNLGRPVNRSGEPVDSDGRVLRDPDGRPLPPAPRSKVCDETGKRFGISTQIDGSWYSRRHARLWSTAMRGKRVLVTVMRGNPPRTRIVTVGRR